MADYVAWQSEVFLRCFLCGFQIWVFYDVIAVLRACIRKRRWWQELIEFVFWLLAAIAMFRVFYTYNDGMLRFHTIFGIFIGICLHQICLTNIFIKKIDDFREKNRKKS